VTSKPDTTVWRFYRDGVITPITEEEARRTFDAWNILSDDRGAALLLIEQMWAEIDRLRMAETYLKKQIQILTDAVRAARVAAVSVQP